MTTSRYAANTVTSIDSIATVLQSVAGYIQACAILKISKLSQDRDIARLLATIPIALARRETGDAIIGGSWRGRSLAATGAIPLTSQR